MTINRRDLIRTTVAFGSAASIVSRVDGSRALASTSGEVSVEEVTSLAVIHFTSKGYSAGTRKSIITDTDYNGGLNYDEDGFGKGSPRSLYVIQPCARIEDAQSQGKPGTLPVFTMFGLYPAEAVTAQRQTNSLLEFLTRVSGLDPKLLRVTTTDLARPLFSEFERHGISETQIRLRPLAEAKADGTGSGWFQPKGHPNAPAFASYSIEFVMANGTEIEIAEAAVEFGPPHNGGCGFGIERLTMARNNRFINWDQGMQAFKKAVLAEAQQTGKSLPSGYFAILGLPQPD